MHRSPFRLEVRQSTSHALQRRQVVINRTHFDNHKVSGKDVGDGSKLQEDYGRGVVFKVSPVELKLDAASVGCMRDIASEPSKMYQIEDPMWRRGEGEAGVGSWCAGASLARVAADAIGTSDILSCPCYAKVN